MTQLYLGLLSVPHFSTRLSRIGEIFFQISGLNFVKKVRFLLGHMTPPIMLTMEDKTWVSCYPRLHLLLPLSFSFLLRLGSVSCSPGWPGTQHKLERLLRLRILGPPTSDCRYLCWGRASSLTLRTTRQSETLIGNYILLMILNGTEQSLEWDNRQKSL